MMTNLGETTRPDLRIEPDRLVAAVACGALSARPRRGFAAEGGRDFAGLEKAHALMRAAARYVAARVEESREDRLARLRSGELVEPHLSRIRDAVRAEIARSFGARGLRAVERERETLQDEVGAALQAAGAREREPTRRTVRCADLEVEGAPLSRYASRWLVAKRDVAEAPDFLAGLRLGARHRDLDARERELRDGMDAAHAALEVALSARSVDVLLSAWPSAKATVDAILGASDVAEPGAEALEGLRRIHDALHPAEPAAPAAVAATDGRAAPQAAEERRPARPRRKPAQDGRRRGRPDDAKARRGK